MGSSVKLIQNKPLHHIFTTVPPRYDLINHLITWGLDRRWRSIAARECLSVRPTRALDLCCGTGDLAIYLSESMQSNSDITGIDYSLPMLEIAVRKAEGSTRSGEVSFIHGDAAALPFPDGDFDCVGISFAFRNLTYKNPLALRYIAEVLRVLKPGGRFVIVESSQPKNRLIKKFFHLYLRYFVYGIGSWVSGNSGAYRYLSESAARYYSGEELKDMLLAAGFWRVSFRRLFLGAAAIHVAVKWGE